MCCLVGLSVVWFDVSVLFLLFCLSDLVCQLPHRLSGVVVVVVAAAAAAAAGATVVGGGGRDGMLA